MERLTRRDNREASFMCIEELISAGNRRPHRGKAEAAEEEGREEGEEDEGRHRALRAGRP